MTIAALVISIVSAIGGAAGVVGLVFARKSANAASESAAASRDSAAAAQVQAAAAREQLAIERARRHQEMTPGLEGRVIWAGTDGRSQSRLEVGVTTPTPLMWLTVTLPAGAPVGAGGSSGHAAYDLSYPPPGGGPAHQARLPRDLDSPESRAPRHRVRGHRKMPGRAR